ncbi:MAG TPA: carbohydrate-binding protein, partial [Acidimicrobiales bacterium]|nr:carbohydrate-binding protein [Acidimicrobiales bacterium]
VASGAASGVSGLVNVVLDNPSNAPIGSFAVGSTGGWSTWQSVPANITTTSGAHTVYLEFSSGQSAAYVSLHYFSFTGGTTTTAPAATTTTTAPATTTTTAPTTTTTTGTGANTSFNNTGISADSNPGGANFDGSGWSYSATALANAGVVPGSTVASDGFSFTWPNVAAGSPDNWQAAGQTVPLSIPAGSTQLGILGAAGAASSSGSSGTATVNYSDGTTSTFTMMMPDWALGGGGFSLPAGYTEAITSAYRNGSGGSQTLTMYVFATSVALNGSKTVVSVTLPSSVSSGNLHVFAFAGNGAAFNNTGISADSNPGGANFDGAGWSYSATALANAGVTPGSTVSSDGFNFTWPNVAAGSPDNWQAAGQTIGVTIPAGSANLGILGAAGNAPAAGSSGTATVNYTDGSSSTFTLMMPDWALGGGGDALPAGYTEAITSAYRNGSGGSQTLTMYVFATSVAIDPSKTVASVTLPSSVSGGNLHVFAFSGAGTAPATGGNLGTLGPNVYVFSPSEAQSTIQGDINTLYNAQVTNQFGSQRYALLFEPGTYGTASSPLTVNVGFYEEVAGLGQSPTATVINGVVNSYNQCSGTVCQATDNFWRSIYNLTINVSSAGAIDSCHNNNYDFWATSQDSPIRRVQVNGGLTLMDFCDNPGYASGGYMGDSEFNGSEVQNDSQQQFFVQNSNIDSWTNGVWNQVFCGDNGAPAQSFSANSGLSGGTQPYTTLATCGPTREEPYLYEDSSGGLDVFVPSVATAQVGPTWASGNTPGTSLPMSTFYVTTSSTTAEQVNAALAAGDNILFTPGVYNFDEALQVTNADTKLIGLGFPTIIPTNGTAAIDVADVAGVNISGMIIDAGPVNSPVLLQIGAQGSSANFSSDPVTVDDLNIRIGGAEVGSATTAMIDNSNYSLLDNVWLWRADHGAGGGSWTSDQSATGLIVNGNNVSAYGLAVEHFQQYETEWNGQAGTVVFFQNENPYEVPSQSAWMSSSTQDGYPAFYIPNSVTSFQGYGMGSYSYFDQGVAIENAMGFQAPSTSGVQFHDIFTRFLNGSGGIESVINGTGAAVNSSFNGPSDVVSYS